MSKSIIKRNGSRVDFESYKIKSAIEKAFKSVGEPFDPEVFDHVLEIVNSVNNLTVEKVQDVIEETMMTFGHNKVASSFIKYRFLHKLKRENVKEASPGSTLIDCTQTVKEYIDKSDWRIHANSNTTYSNAGLVNNTAGKVIANFWLDNVYTPEEGAAHRNGDYHIHDLDCLTGYCFSGDTRILLWDGGDISFKDLVKEYELNKVSIINVVSKNKNGEIVKGVGINPRITRKNAELIELKLCTGHKIKCTPDHKFMLMDGTYKEASKLSKLDSLSGAVYLTLGATVEESPVYVCSIKKLNKKEDVYCLTVPEYENFAIAAGVFVHNCAGWSLRNLLNEGFNGVRSRVNSRPPKHFREALGQMANFLGILQSEWAGAQAFSSFDTYLAPYLFKDQLSYNKTKKAIRSFVYNLNVPSRWGQCVPTTYKCLKADGTWASYDELKIGDEIFVVDLKKAEISTDTVTHVNIHESPGIMHEYTNTTSQQSFVVTSNHRVIYAEDGFSNKYRIVQSADLIKNYTAAYIPIYNVDACSKNNFENSSIVKCGVCNVLHKIDVVASLNDKVWCPTTDTGTFICKTDKGYVFLTGNSPFTNVTIDWTVPKDLREQPPFSGGAHLFDGISDEKLEKIAKERGCDKLTDMTYKHFQPEMNVIQRAFYEVLTEGDSTGQPFTFPIPTVNITEDFDWEGENVPLLFENAAKIGSSYFQNFIGSQYKYDENGNKVIDEEAYKPDAVRSMCPLTPDTEVIVESNSNIYIRKIGEMFKCQNMKGTSYKSYYKGTWSNCRVIKVENQDVYSISLTNNIECRMGGYHEQPILRDGKCITVSAQDIKVGDYIPFNNYVIDGKINASYNFGFVIGAYLGDGSKDNEGINYSLCADKVDDNIANQLTEFFESLGFKVTVSVTGKLRSLRVGAGSFNLISRFLTGTNALDKGLSKNVLSLSVDARRGILDGLIASDGDASKKRVSTSSKNMVESIVSLASSIGVIAYLSYVDSRDNRLGSNPNYIITVVREKKNYKNKFLTVNNQLYMAVTNVNKLDSYNGELYCLEVDNDSHLFTLANGMITHNCRLQLDLRELLKRGGGLFGSAEMTGSIGVVTINMARLGYLYKGDKDALYNRLDALMDLAKDTLEKKRKFITDLYNRGLYPFTKRYLPGFRNHFSTIGVNGMNEMLRNFSDDTMSTATEDGVKFSEDILHHIREKIRSYQEETGNLYNLEATPAEGCFSGETLVWTKGGFERIQYLLGEKDVEVYTMNETTGCIELKPVEDIFMTDTEAQVMQIKFTNGMSVVCTLLHPFAVPNRKAKESNNSIKWVEATNLTIGELVFGTLVKNNDKNTVINYEEVCYEVQDIVYLDKKVPVYNMTVKGNSNYYVMDPNKEGSCLLVHNCTHRFAREDQKRFPDIIQAGYPGHRYYTNSSQLPVNYTSDLFLALKMQDKLQCCYTGGTTFHMYMSEAISSPEACRDIVRKVLTNFKMPYVTVTPLFSICEKHGYLKGQHEYCPICDQEIIDKAILEESKSTKNGAST